MSSTSILINTKKVLGIEETYDAFDADVIMHINTAFSTLHQLGIGPSHGFAIEDEEATWSSFLGSDVRLNLVKSYIFVRVRLLFDPPGTSYLIDSLKKQAEEMEWRLTVLQDEELEEVET